MLLEQWNDDHVINTPPTLRGMPIKMIGYKVDRYEFQVISVIGTMK